MSGNFFELPDLPECPTCGAAPNKPCTTLKAYGGLGRVTAHAARFDDHATLYKTYLVWCREDRMRMNKSMGDVLSDLAERPVPQDDEVPRVEVLTRQSTLLSSSKTLSYLKRWRSLEERGRVLDYDISKWCHELRSEFSSGSVGDEKFRDWIDAEIDVAANRREELIMRAAAFSAVPDQTQYEALGGYRHVRQLVPLSKRDRVSVIGEAKAEGRLVGAIATRLMRSRRREKIERQRPAQAPQPVYVPPPRIDFIITPAEMKAWRATATAAGRKVEDWAREVCNAAAKVKVKP